MKTSELILQKSAALFNERGERNVAASDIALELDISSGNLYYHFRGKDQILSALFSSFYRVLFGMLSAPVIDKSFLKKEDILERSWFFFAVVLEKMFANRFFYQNLNDLMYRYPEIDRGMTRLVGMKRQVSKALAAELLESVSIKSHPEKLERISDNMAMTMIYWLNFYYLTGSNETEEQAIHRAILQILSHCAPYLGEKQCKFYEECEIIHTGLLD